MSLILVDGSALVYRSHYAFANRPLTSPSGELTSVAFGFFSSVLRLIEDRAPSHLAVVFDLPGKNFRHAIFPEYKAHRKPMPEEIVEQLPRLRELLDAWGVPVLEKAGVEADDVMGTLARQASAAGQQVWLYTGDKDFMQLLDGNIGMLKPGRRGDEITVLEADDVRREYGLEPAELIEVFALSGDKADNIPGAPGVGDKTALKLIQDFGSLDGLFDALEASKLTPRLKRVIGENRDQVYLSRELFTIRTNVDLPGSWRDLRTVLPTGDEVSALLQELGLRRVRQLIDRLAAASTNPGTGGEAGEASPGPDPAPPTEPAPAAADSWAGRRRARGYERLADLASLETWLGDMDPEAPLAIDTETDALRKDTCRLVGISLAGSAREGRTLPPAYVPVLWREEDDHGGAGTLFPEISVRSRLEEVRSVLQPFLAGSNLKVGQNLKFDEWILERHGFRLSGPRFDTMLASYILDPGRRSHGLDDLVLDLLGHRMMPYAELFAPGDKSRDILAVDPDRLALYAAEDADYTLQLFVRLQEELRTEGMEGLFRELEMPVARVLLVMERNGIMIDRPFLAELRERFEAELAEYTRRIHELAGEAFNIQSPKQLGVVLFEKLGLKPLKKTATGWSTDVDVLTALAEEHELPALILEYRQIAKLQNTYVETLPDLANPDTGLIHTSYNQAVAATGRLSSSDPNLQNIPVRTELGRQIRRAFVPRAEDHLFLSADYSQVELRLLAHLADDPGLQQAFRDGADVHRRTAALIAGVGEDEVTAGMRSRAKAINFGVIYGMGARALARQIGVKVAEAAEFIDTYFRTYPGVRDFIEATKEAARREGSVATLLGRRRLLPDIQSANNRIRSFQERVAVNTPIQGTAADLIKLAMVRIQESLDASDLRAMLLMQVHDELVLEVHRGDLAPVGDLVRTGMEEALDLKVPLVVDIHTGRNWAEAHG
ncbi:MAG: DNA polymerase I [bacterium]